MRAAGPPARVTNRVRIVRWRSLSSAPPMITRCPARGRAGRAVAAMRGSLATPTQPRTRTLVGWPPRRTSPTRSSTLRRPGRRSVGHHRRAAGGVPACGPAPPPRSERAAIRSPPAARRSSTGRGPSCAIRCGDARTTGPGAGEASTVAGHWPPANRPPRPSDPTRAGCPPSRARGTSRPGARSPGSGFPPRSSSTGRTPSDGGSWSTTSTARTGATTASGTGCGSPPRTTTSADGSTTGSAPGAAGRDRPLLRHPGPIRPARGLRGHRPHLAGAAFLAEAGARWPRRPRPARGCSASSGPCSGTFGSATFDAGRRLNERRTRICSSTISRAWPWSRRRPTSARPTSPSDEPGATRSPTTCSGGSSRSRSAMGTAGTRGSSS